MICFFIFFLLWACFLYFCLFLQCSFLFGWSSNKKNFALFFVKLFWQEDNLCSRILLYTVLSKGREEFCEYFCEKTQSYWNQLEAVLCQFFSSLCTTDLPSSVSPRCSFLERNIWRLSAAPHKHSWELPAKHIIWNTLDAKDKPNRGCNTGILPGDCTEKSHTTGPLNFLHSAMKSQPWHLGVFGRFRWGNNAGKILPKLLLFLLLHRHRSPFLHWIGDLGQMGKADSKLRNFRQKEHPENWIPKENLEFWAAELPRLDQHWLPHTTENFEFQQNSKTEI